MKLFFASRRNPSALKFAGTLGVNWLWKLGTATPPAACDGGGAATVSLPSPAYCNPPGAACARGFMNARAMSETTTTAASPSRTAIMTEPRLSPNSQARPRPAARPASAPIQGLIGFLAPAAAAVEAGAACCAAGGVTGLSGKACRWAPVDRPPPRRRASASSTTKTLVKNSADRAINMRFIASSRDGFSVSHAAVQRYHARGEVEVFDVFQPGLFHHRPQCLLVGVHADRLGQVAVARFVFRHLPSEPW